MNTSLRMAAMFKAKMHYCAADAIKFSCFFRASQKNTIILVGYSACPISPRARLV
ncbi:hypothetical protein [uncultured Pseudosulfitobacter sp.]|jgi:hypothetical protein|uniref:hypothetical protein n=1 Tax=uncultured Pseudosulfitobacter sp. TaxID=2854214 RepID=UPI0030DCDBDB|tara:strand:+ start:473 stop:637 length:165 start_codon:yes stop_codon:yes gene_type:complete